MAAAAVAPLSSGEWGGGRGLGRMEEEGWRGPRACAAGTPTTRFPELPEAHVQEQEDVTFQDSMQPSFWDSR